MHPLPQLAALAQVIVIDLSLAADNALVIGSAAAGLPKAERHRAVMIGLGGAVVIRIILACFAVKLLAFAGLTLAGGLLLLWVTWKMVRQARAQKTGASSPRGHEAAGNAPKKLSAAVLQILLADLGMSLDNILGVAGAAHNHYLILAIGLVLSVALTGAAATASAKFFHRWPWLNWIGVATVLWVAISMMASGLHQVVMERGLI